MNLVADRIQSRNGNGKDGMRPLPRISSRKPRFPSRSPQQDRQNGIFHHMRGFAYCHYNHPERVGRDVGHYPPHDWLDYPGGSAPGARIRRRRKYQRHPQNYRDPIFPKYHGAGHARDGSRVSGAKQLNPAQVWLPLLVPTAQLC